MVPFQRVKSAVIPDLACPATGRDERFPSGAGASTTTGRKLPLLPNHPHHECESATSRTFRTRGFFRSGAPGGKAITT